MRLLKSCLAVSAVSLLLASPAFSLAYPLSETAAREAYFLGQRRDASTGQFLARYAKHLPAPKSGPGVSDITFFTPFAQLVEYSSKQGQYNAQQAELDGKTRFNTVEITVYITLTETYGAYIASLPGSPYSTPGISLRRSDFWREFNFRVLDNNDPREPASIYAEPEYRCADDGGCLLVGSQVHLSLPVELFSSSSATIEVSTPDDQLITANFDLATLR